MFDFKGLISALRRRGRDEITLSHSATIMMAELPRSQALNALTEIIKALATVNRNPKIGLKERYRSVQVYDEKAQPLVAVLVRVYRGEEQVEGIHPRQALPSLLACWRELASGYKVCLKQHAQSPSSRFAADAELITLRAVQYYAEQAKWAYLRYYEVEARLWRSLNRLYQIAEAAGFADKALNAYSGTVATSVSSVYRHALLLKLSEPERRRAEDLWLVDSWVGTWIGRVNLEKVIRPRDQTFAINLDEPKPPMKLRRNMVGERYRYLDTQPLSDYLAELAVSAARGAFPVAMTTPPEAEIPNAARLLADLAIVYSREGQNRSRRSERRSRERPTSSAVGLAQISKLLGHTGSTATWDNWTLADESANGVGVHYKARYDDRLTIGEIVAMKDDEGVVLAVVRRLSKSREGEVKVGAERLANKPLAVVLQGKSEQISALYCAESPHGRMLVMAAGSYSAGKAYTLSAGPKRFHIQIGQLLEAIPGYAICAFSVTGKEATA